jgi:short subunit dehydrogenase-like uncharacterized protein
LEWRIVDWTDATRLRAALGDVGAVCHAAGQYPVTTPALVAACLATGTAYVDIANEIPVLQYLQTQDTAARSAKIPLLFGAGFGVVVAECLAQFVIAQLPGAVRLRCATHIGTAQAGSVGATLSGLEIVRGGGRVVRQGRLVPYRLGRGTQAVRFADITRTASPAPFGDLLALMATGVPDITFYSTALPMGLGGALLPVIRRALAVPFVRRQMERQAAHAEAPAVTETVAHSQAWAWAQDRQGQEREAWLEMGDGYSFAATASVLAMEEILGSNLVGTLTPAQAFGADFVLRVPDTQRLITLA